MQVEIQADGSKKILELNDSVFAVPYNNDLVHQVVTAYMAGARAGTKAQKSRSDVSGGGAKPWKQKGTGRARAGTIRSPIWRSGGVTFAARPRSFEQKVNKKVYRKAISCILSQLLNEGCITVVDKFDVDSPKTSAFKACLAEKKFPQENLLIITDSISENIYLASRNIPTVEVIDDHEINPYILLKYKSIIVTEAAMKGLEELFA
jgi:large subunit ribosomal protein L4